MSNINKANKTKMSEMERIFSMLGVDLETTPIAEVLKAISEKGVETLSIKVGGEDGKEILGCFILCGDSKIAQKLCKIIGTDDGF